jgi:hypothetical protein
MMVDEMEIQWLQWMKWRSSIPRGEILKFSSFEEVIILNSSRVSVTFFCIAGAGVANFFFRRVF